jgi:hypothetical protein
MAAAKLAAANSFARPAVVKKAVIESNNRGIFSRTAVAITSTGRRRTQVLILKAGDLSHGGNPPTIAAGGGYLRKALMGRASNFRR